jgi:hypothetical protein
VISTRDMPLCRAAAISANRIRSRLFSNAIAILSLHGRFLRGGYYRINSGASLL